MTSKLCLLALCAGALVLPAQQRVDKSTLDRWMQELSNWGRWGKADQLGTVNLITAAKRKSAAALVKEGFAVSLSSNAETSKSADNPFPLGLDMLSTGADPNPMFAMETLTIRYHGLALTHLDALSHMFHQGKMYNGYTQDQVNKQGAQQLSVIALKNGLISRGILMDIPRLKGVKYLEPSTPVFPADFDAWEKKAGIKVGAGDIVFVRTGRWSRRAKIERWHKSLKGECIRPGTPLSLEEARRLVQSYVEHYNNVRLNSAIGYITPKDMLAGRQHEIHAERDRKLEAARKQRQIRRYQAA